MTEEMRTVSNASTEEFRVARTVAAAFVLALGGIAYALPETPTPAPAAKAIVPAVKAPAIR